MSYKSSIDLFSISSLTNCLLYFVGLGILWPIDIFVGCVETKPFGDGWALIKFLEWVETYWRGDYILGDNNRFLGMKLLLAVSYFWFTFAGWVAKFIKLFVII